MKKDTKNLLLLGAAGVGGYFLYTKVIKKDGAPTTAGVPGIGMTFPDHSLVPTKYRGQPSPWWFDAALWGALGTAVGYYALAGKKLKLLG